MSFDRLFLAVYGHLKPVVFELHSQETRIADGNFVARILEDGSVAVQPDDGDELIVPHDGSVVSGRLGQTRSVRICVCHTMGDASRKLGVLSATDQSTRDAERTYRL